VDVLATDIYDIQQTLWAIADELRANSNLSSSEYSTPVLGLIFLKFADDKFDEARVELGGTGSDRRKIGPVDYHAKKVLYLPPEAEFDYLLALPEAADVGQAISDAMRMIEEHNPDLDGVLPKDYQRFENRTLFELLRAFDGIPSDLGGDAFGKIYEYFLGKFAMSEGQRGGEFFTPTSIVELIVRIIEPAGGKKILDPACGSGGMFVQSARFVEEHRDAADDRISIYGQERVTETVKLAKMNLAVHGLAGDIREANTYYEDPHDCVGQFDYVMANPPFNVDKVDKARIEDDPRYPFGIPKRDNANYLWIQSFYSALNDTGRAGFVMANSASDAGHSELEIRRQLIETRAVSAIVSVGTNFFYTVALPVTLWFLDKGKVNEEDWADWTLFIDARDVFTQVDRAHREWTPAQIEFLANIQRLYWQWEPTLEHEGTKELLDNDFPDGTYTDVPGLCRFVHIDEIEEQGWSLHPGRYVGVKVETIDEGEFQELFTELTTEFNQLSEQAVQLTARIQSVMRQVNG
jgi:type I restriction enzyme M protein